MATRRDGVQILVCAAQMLRAVAALGREPNRIDSTLHFLVLFVENPSILKFQTSMVIDTVKTGLALPL